MDGHQTFNLDCTGSNPVAPTIEEATMTEEERVVKRHFKRLLDDLEGYCEKLTYGHPPKWQQEVAEEIRRLKAAAVRVNQAYNS